MLDYDCLLECLLLLQLVRLSRRSLELLLVFVIATLEEHCYRQMQGRILLHLIGKPLFGLNLRVDRVMIVYCRITGLLCG